MLHNEIGKCVFDWPPPFSRPSHFRKICVPFIHQSSPFNKQISYAKREKEKGNILGSSSNTETYLLPFGRLYSPLNKRWRKKPIFYQNKIIIISRFDWVPCRITAPEWKKLSKSEHNLFDFYHFCCLTRFFSFLFQALPISMLFSIYIGAQTSRTFSLHIFFVFVICAARLRNSSSVFARNMQSSDKSRTHFIWHSNANARQKRSSANGDFHSQQRAMFCLATIQPFFSHHFHYSFWALDVETHHLNYHYCSTDLFIDSTVHLEISYLTQITSFVRFSVSFVFSAANSDECVTDCNESNGVLAVQYQ